MNWPALGGLILTCVIIFFVAKKFSSPEPDERAIRNEELRRALMIDTILRYGFWEELVDEPGSARVIDKIRRMLKL